MEKDKFFKYDKEPNYNWLLGAKDPIAVSSNLQNDNIDVDLLLRQQRSM